MLAGFRRREMLTDMLLRRAEGDVYIVKKAFHDVAAVHGSRVDLPFEEVIERIDVRLAEYREKLQARVA